MAVRQSKTLEIKKSRNIVLQENNVKYIIKQSQQYMSKLVENLQGFEPFNNTVKPDDCVDRLVAHRIVSQFHIEDTSVLATLRSDAFANYITYDQNLSTELNLWESYDLRKAHLLLCKWFRNFKVDVANIRFEVSPGETFISSQGEVSLLAKLFDVSHWTTTANCLDDTVLFIYNNASFKRVARQHINDVYTRKEKRILYSRFKNTADIGFNIFKHQLIERVLILVDGARATSVPKSNLKRRFINIEAMFPIILQRAGAQEILRVLARHGNDLGNYKTVFRSDTTGARDVEHSAQHLHGLMIRSDRFSTIDFSSASDSVTVSAVASLFPKQVSDYLFRTRSHFVEVDGELYNPKKLSSMGNGYTFEVMTAMLYAIASSITPFCRVYGDDVIIPNEFAHRFVRACKLIDFNVNEDKTFIDSFFRESCGYFYNGHKQEYVTSFDFGQIKNLSDVIITCNKLTVIMEAGQVSPDLHNELEVCRDRIAALVHASRKGPVPPTLKSQRKFLALYIFDKGFQKKQRRCKELTFLRQHYIRKNSEYFNNCQIERNDWSLVYLPFFVPKKSKHIFTDMHSSKILLPALYSGKRLKASIKGKGRWIDLPAFVHNDGTITLISNLISSSSSWVNRLDGVILSHQKM